ncbi:MAG: LrgB family protein [Betaproteobacteria bacterium]|nr:LrgB family protein [Betaproteobacteria bacterium]
MSDFVELWIYLSATPLFGLTASLSVYVMAHTLYSRLNQTPIANPVLWSVIVLAGILHLTRTPYQTYFSGAQFIHFLLGPAVVALAWPLWERRVELKKRAPALIVAAIAGGLAAALSAVVMGYVLGLPDEVLRSLAPKSVTAPVAMGVAERIGGIPALAAVFAVITGMIGALSAKYLFDRIGIHSPAVRGFALGTASHGIGAARAMQVHPDAGAYAGLALGIQVIVASLSLPLIARLF